MTNQAPEQLPEEDIPEAVVTKSSGISIVWLIPIVAALIGGWIAYKAFSEIGPTITISFETADGLVAGKTKVKYKNVEVGLVEDIVLDEKLDSVLVTVQMDKGSEEYLTEKTRFWVVRARISAGSVSGLDTLLGGAYIGIDPVAGGKFIKKFTGLEKAPVVTSDQPGQHFILKADRLGSLNVGAPIYFRQIKVGEVVQYELAEDDTSVDFKVFINAPHHIKVTENTRFWNASGVDVSLSSEGLDVEMESMVSLLIGGIAFEVREDEEKGEPAAENTVFKLFHNHEAAYEKKLTIKERALLYFDGSVRGLEQGAPVEFRGIRLGQVLDINAEYNQKTLEFKIPVLIELEPERLGGPYREMAMKERLSQLDRLVANGMRAQLKTGNLITGKLYVEMDFYPDAAKEEARMSGKYPVIPTIPTSLDQLTKDVKALLAKMNQFPMDQIGKELTKSLADLDKTIIQAEQTLKTIDHLFAPDSPIPQDLQKVFHQAEATLKTIDHMFAPNAPLPQELQQALQEMSRATRSLRVLADYLERHPEALIKGKE